MVTKITKKAKSTEKQVPTKTTKTSKTKKQKTSSVDKLVVQKSKPRVRVEPDNWYVGKLLTAEVKESKLFGGEYIQMDFELTKHPDNVCEDGVTTAAGLRVGANWALPVSFKRKVYKVLCGITGKTLEIDEHVNLKAYYGKTYRLLIVDKENKDESGNPWQNVSLVKPLKKRVAK